MSGCKASIPISVEIQKGRSSRRQPKKVRRKNNNIFSDKISRISSSNE